MPACAKYCAVYPETTRIVKVAEEVTGAATERRIAWLTLLLGLAAAAILALARQRPWATGLAIGTVLAWLNFRWLKRGLDALVLASEAQQGREKPRVPLATRSEEHTSELQSPDHLVCRLLLEKKKK